MQATPYTVLITGGASGIGFALAQKFHQAGHKVVLAGRNAAALQNAAQRLPGVHTIAADVGLAEDRARLVEELSDLTVLVNNAGIQYNGTVGQANPADLSHELQVNFLAPVLLTQAFLPILMRQPKAAVVNVSSALALVPKQSAAMYCASKAALHSFSQTLRWQLETSSVRVFEVLPPLVETAMTAGRGKGKITPAQLADEFWRGFTSEQFEMRIGKAKVLAQLQRFVPALAEKIVRHG